MLALVAGTVSYLHMHRACESDGNVSRAAARRAKGEKIASADRFRVDPDVLLFIRAVLRLFPAEGFEDGVSERVRQECWLGLPLMHLPRGTSSSRTSVSPPRSSRSIPSVKLSYSCRAHLRHNHLSHSNPAVWRLTALLKAAVRRSSPLTIASRATERSSSAGVFKSLVLRLRPGRLA